MQILTACSANIRITIAKMIWPGLLCAVLLAISFSLGSAQEGGAQKDGVQKLVVGQSVKRAIDADYPWQLELTDSDGQSIKLSDYRGRTLLLSFFYATCGYACPVQTARLAQVQKSLKPDSLAASRFVSVSIHPKRDTPRVIDAFKRPYDIKEAHWQFGTPTDADQLNRLLLQAGVSTKSVAGLDQTDHKMKILLIDPAGKVRQRYVGDKFSIKRVAKEVEALVRLSSRS